MQQRFMGATTKALPQVPGVSRTARRLTPVLLEPAQSPGCKPTRVFTQPRRTGARTRRTSPCLISPPTRLPPRLRLDPVWPQWREGHK